MRAAVLEKALGPFRTVVQGLCLMLPLGGCLLTDKPEPGLDIPQAYDRGPRDPVAAEAALPPLDWWHGFRSRELTEIIEEARSANLDIAAAVARIVQADAQSRITGSALLPTVNLNGDATRARSSQAAGGLGSSSTSVGGGSERDLLSASLTASYEIDFWGKNRSATRAAEELAVASRFDREVVGLTTVVATANAYFQVLAAQDRLQVARDNQAAATRVLNLIQQRLNAGTASALDTAQQESLVNTQRAAIPPLEQIVTQNRNALALLMARSPESVRVRGGSLRSISYPRVTPGLPSELLAQRPDIREAEANLAAANANVENARAQMLPSITLTGEGGYQSAVLRTLLRAGIGVLYRDPPVSRSRSSTGSGCKVISTSRRAVRTNSCRITAKR
ncbi:MAG: efflux transporter outer membrane subunit [Pseudolabrys sp.]